MKKNKKKDNENSATFAQIVAILLWIAAGWVSFVGLLAWQFEWFV